MSQAASRFPGRKRVRPGGGSEEKAGAGGKRGQEGGRGGKLGLPEYTGHNNNASHSSAGMHKRHFLLSEEPLRDQPRPGVARSLYGEFPTRLRPSPSRAHGRVYYRPGDFRCQRGGRQKGGRKEGGDGGRGGGEGGGTQGPSDAGIFENACEYSRERGSWSCAGALSGSGRSPDPEPRRS